MNTNTIKEQHKEMALRLAKPGQAILDTLTAWDCHLTHMGGCLMGEAAELHESARGMIMGWKSAGSDGFVEELGDYEFYHVVCCAIFEMDATHAAEPSNAFVVTKDCPTWELRLHNCVGLMEIGGHFWDTVKRIVVYRKDWLLADKKFEGKSLKQVGMDQLMGMRWFLNNIYATIPETREEVLRANIQKLDGARYKTGAYSDAQAIERADKSSRCAGDGQK